ncbi:MAG: hypothetical protein JSS75_08730 [Bacteroidetes bacterium]|nr:hypothetical protein [Bacteroidota bacterium]
MGRTIACVFVLAVLLSACKSSTDSNTDPLSGVTWKSLTLGSSLTYLVEELDSTDNLVAGKAFQLTMVVDSVGLAEWGRTNVIRIRQDDPQPIFISYDENGDLLILNTTTTNGVVTDFSWERLPVKSRIANTPPTTDSTYPNGNVSKTQVTDTFDGSENITTAGKSFGCARVISTYVGSTDYPSGGQSKYVTTTTSWYAPELGFFVEYREKDLSYSDGTITSSKGWLWRLTSYHIQ